MNERIVFTNPDGSCGVLIPTGEIPIDEVKAKDVPAGASNVRQITTAELPADRLFRSAWDDSNPENHIGLNLVKAQAIAHDMRRAKRAEDFTPHDEVIAKNIPGTDLTAAEDARAAIRTEDASVQTDIDGAVNEAALRAVLSAASI